MEEESLDRPAGKAPDRHPGPSIPLLGIPDATPSPFQRRPLRELLEARVPTQRVEVGEALQKWGEEIEKILNAEVSAQEPSADVTVGVSFPRRRRGSITT